MSEPVKDPLRELFRRELDAFAAEATQTDSMVSPGRIEALSGLAKLIEARDSLRPKPRNWWAALVLFSTLGVVSLLLFARVRETDIELDILLAQVSFSLAKAQALTAAIDLSALGISGLQNIQLPPSSGESPSVNTNLSDSAPAVSLTASSAGERHGTVTLAPLSLQADTRLILGPADVANQYRLSMNATNLLLHAAVYGPVDVGLAGSPARALDFATPKQVTFRGGSEEVNLDLSFRTILRSPIAPQLQVRDIAFSRVDQFLDSEQALVKRLSTILSGTLSFESLGGQELRLRPGEGLQFEHSQGEIRSLEFATDHVRLKFHARVRGMKTGTGEGQRSIMPTYLEWLKARHGLSLLWVTSLYIFGLVAGTLRWFGVRV